MFNGGSPYGFTVHPIFTRICMLSTNHVNNETRMHHGLLAPWAYLCNTSLTYNDNFIMYGSLRLGVVLNVYVQGASWCSLKSQSRLNIHISRTLVTADLVAPDILVLCFHFGPSVFIYLSCLEIWGWSIRQRQVAFLRPPVHTARWAHMHHFLSVCPSASKNAFFDPLTLISSNIWSRYTPSPIPFTKCSVCMSNS